MNALLEHDGGAIAFGLDNLVPSRLSELPSQSGAVAWYSPKVYLHRAQATRAYWPGRQEVSWAERLADRFSLLRRLEPRWDGHNAPPIDEEILASGWRWLQAIAQVVRVPPSVVPTNAGGIAFEWHRPAMDLEIELSPGGAHYVGYEDAQGNEFEGPLEAHVEAVARALVSLQ